MVRINKTQYEAQNSYENTPAQRRSRDPGIPHSSWRETIASGRQSAGRVVDAGDFWARLGI